MSTTVTNLPPGVYPDGANIPDGRENLFTVNGHAYTAQAQCPPSVMLRYLRDTHRRGEEAAVGGLMDAVLGPDAMDLLIDDNLDPDEYRTVMQVMQRYSVGQNRRLLGNAPGGQA